MLEIDDKLQRKYSQQMDGLHDEDEELRLKIIAKSYAECENCISVLSNHRTGKSFIYLGRTADILGLDVGRGYVEIDSIWEEDILGRVHPDDFRRRILQELAFSHYVASLHSNDAFAWYMENTMRMSNKQGEYHPVKHRIFYFPSKGQHGISYALCLYNITLQTSRRALLKNTMTGEERQLDVDDRQLLTQREITILKLVAAGLSSKAISLKLEISKNTVDRHRQNIISKMQASNMAEAAHKAKQLGLIE